jgi:hypothetical protein
VAEMVKYNVKYPKYAKTKLINAMGVFKYPHRGSGFFEVFECSSLNQLDIGAQMKVQIQIPSAKTI